ncbi:MAG TPA: tRNA (adenosine(37)-N6)-threonylcarbamoyltransferase complex dimerization subunit type 1 TsaB [Gemmatimonadaceae bacterium]|nr:tRNA (adenosine(37)-N6)-threonylcarbamoyltransferase complex dimerization subunit type 1 TsaB [Gemmatimonadaceae bacterium]
MLTLALDASTYAGDVALLDDTRLVAEESVAMKDAAHERLMPAVALVLERAGQSIADVDRIVCGAGPGSFTSLRIAGGIAKGLATGASKPLFSVPSMALTVGGASLDVGRYLVAVDALRGEFYVGLYHVSAASDVIELERARLVAADDVSGIAHEFDARVVSPSSLPDLPDAIVAHPKARAVARLGAWLDATGPVDVATWEPAYGRLAEAQVKWESTHGRPLPTE